MKPSVLAKSALGLTLLGSAVAAHASVVTFTGSMSDIGIAGFDASCDPLPFHGQATGSGSSSVGDFTYSHDICFSPVVPADSNFVGTFTLNFGAYSLFGTMSGSDSPDAIPGVFDLMWNYTILGGTGQFFNASGMFTGIGTSDGRNPPTQQNLAFNGFVDAPGVPEPATWSLLLLGLGLTGGMLRRTGRPATKPCIAST